MACMIVFYTFMSKDFHTQAHPSCYLLIFSIHIVALFHIALLFTATSKMKTNAPKFNYCSNPTYSYTATYKRTEMLLWLYSNAINYSNKLHWLFKWNLPFESPALSILQDICNFTKMCMWMTGLVQKFKVHTLVTILG